ncbi:Protein of unknown function [Pyronema omphalodes CBS 100304]|uniref:Uncharacterized protein n=1 Tax=Pyronema omphalodes (strain CBS 100304) TaxID=1076935 RepID=U4LVF5_PYROM|nr:Protein of unknown function [Pyronema omphalodes CBS 100304]
MNGRDSSVVCLHPDATELRKFAGAVMCCDDRPELGGGAIDGRRIRCRSPDARRRDLRKLPASAGICERKLMTEQPRRSEIQQKESSGWYRFGKASVQASVEDNNK